jgi:hypothetical protein
MREMRQHLRLRRFHGQAVLGAQIVHLAVLDELVGPADALPSTFLPVLLDQRFAIDPCLPCFRHLAMQKLTSLEPRTPRQPEKPRSCQRTI